MVGMTSPVIHRVSSLELSVRPWSWPFAEARCAEISAHFAAKQREKPNMWNGRVLLGREAHVLARVERPELRAAPRPGELTGEPRVRRLPE